MTRNATPGSPAMAEAVDTMRQQIDDLNQRIERQEKRVQLIQISSGNAGRKAKDAGPAAEPQAALAEMVKQRNAMQTELEQLEAQQSLRAD